MDAAKLAAFLCGDTKQKLGEVYRVGLTRGNRLPLIQVEYLYFVIIVGQILLKNPTSSCSYC